MRSVELKPCPTLRPFVRLIWLMEAEDFPNSGQEERIAPDGLVELVFHYRTPMSCRYDGEAFALQPRAAIVSQTRRYVEIQAAGPIGLLSVRFQPWGAYHFFDQPVSEFADHQIPAEALWGRAAIELEERLEACRYDRERVNLVEAFLIDQLSRHQKRPLEIPVRAIWQSRGRMALPRLCRDIGIGERSLQRMFAEGLGATPKQFARLSRFLHACQQLRIRSAGSLAGIGLDCGYYDQSHFISDFRSFSGITPQQFLHRQNLSFLETE